MFEVRYRVAKVWDEPGALIVGAKPRLQLVDVNDTPIVAVFDTQMKSAPLVLYAECAGGEWLRYFPYGTIVKARFEIEEPTHA